MNIYITRTIAVLGFLVFFFGCEKKTVIEQSHIRYTQPLIQMGIIRGNFTNSKYDEYIVFYSDPNINAITGRTDIDKVVIIQKQNQQILKTYDLNTYSAQYTRDILKIIKNKNLSFGEWNGYAYITDFNANGLDEILFFPLGGIGLFVQLFEYNKARDRFEDKLVHEDYSILTSIESITTNQKKYLKACFLGNPEKNKGKLDCIVYDWNKDKEVYDIIEKSKED